MNIFLKSCQEISKDVSRDPAPGADLTKFDSVPNLSVPNVLERRTAAPSGGASATDRIEPYVWKIAGVVILGMTMSILDTTIVNVALDTLGRDLHTHARPDPVGRDRLPAGARRGDPADRLGGAALRRQARLPRLDRPLHDRLGPLRPRRIEHLADPLPRPPGRRRRHDHADRPDDHGRGRRAETDGPGDGHRRDAGDAGADPRPGRRRPDPAEPALVLDLLRQRADRDRRRDPRLADAARLQPRRGGQARLGRPAAAGDQHAADRLRPLGDRDQGKLHRADRDLADRRRPRCWPASSAGTRCASSGRCSTSASTPTGSSPPPR